MDEHEQAASRVLQAVDDLRAMDVAVRRNLLDPDQPAHPGRGDRIQDALRRLDAAVFDLFEANPAERDLVEDFWAEGHDLYWKGSGSKAMARVPLPNVRQGIRSDLPDDPGRGDLKRYLAAFLGNRPFCPAVSSG